MSLTRSIRQTALVLVALTAAIPFTTAAQAQPSNQQRQRYQQHVPQQPPPNIEELWRLLQPPEGEADYERDYDREPRAESPLQRRVPSNADVEAMTPEEQRAILRQALQAMDERLSGVEIGPGWKRYLGTEELGRNLWTNRDPEPDVAARSALQELAGRFSEVASGERYQFVRSGWGFRTIVAVLPVYAMSPVDRTRRQTSNSATALESALDRTSTGPGWNQFLQLADVQRIASAQGDVNADDQAILKAIAAKFEQASEEGKYPRLTRMTGFATTRSSVAQLMQAAREPSAVDQAWARSELGRLMLDLNSLKAGCQKESEAITTWVMAPEDTDAKEEAEAIVMALKDEHDKRQEEAMTRVMGLIDNENRRHDAMGKLVLDLAGMKKELKAAETWVMAPEGSPEADDAREKVADFIRYHEKQRQKREERIGRIIAGLYGGSDDSSSVGGSKVLVMAPEDTSKLATGTVVLAPENGDPGNGDEEEIKYYLMPLPVPDESEEIKYRLVPLPVPEDSEPEDEDATSDEEVDPESDSSEND